MKIQLESQVIDLSERWIELVGNNQVQSVCNVQDESGNTITIQYGLQLVNNEIQQFCVYHDSKTPFLVETDYIPEEIKLTTADSQIPITVKIILNYRMFYTKSDPSIVRLDGKIRQLLLEKPHNDEICSFCVGNWNLIDRPALYKIVLPITRRKLDIHWNIAPQEHKGHFLIVPEITELTNRRHQYLILEDMENLFDLVLHCVDSTSGWFGYNCIGAGASQNHIHYQGFNCSSPVFQHNYTQFTKYSIFKLENWEIEFYLRNNYHSQNCECNCIEIKFKQTKIVELSQEILNEITSFIYSFIQVFIGEQIPFNLLINKEKIFIFVRK